MKNLFILAILFTLVGCSASIGTPRTTSTTTVAATPDNTVYTTPARTTVTRTTY